MAISGRPRRKPSTFLEEVLTFGALSSACVEDAPGPRACASVPARIGCGIPVVRSARTLLGEPLRVSDRRLAGQPRRALVDAHAFDVPPGHRSLVGALDTHRLG